MGERLTEQKRKVFEAKWEKIASLLGPEWIMDYAEMEKYMPKPENTWDFTAILSGPVFKIFAKSGPYSYPDHWRIFPAWPRDSRNLVNLPGEKRANPSSINLRLEKTCEQIAQEIKDRALAPWSAFAAEIVLHNAKADDCRTGQYLSRRESEEGK